MTSVEMCGWISAACLILCSVPQVIKTVREKHAKGLSLSFLVLWLLGDLLGVVYVYVSGSGPLTANYAINTLACLILITYKVKGEKK